jgi:hypothetical protein
VASPPFATTMRCPAEALEPLVANRAFFPFCRTSTFPLTEGKKAKGCEGAADRDGTERPSRRRSERMIGRGRMGYFDFITKTPSQSFGGGFFSSSLHRSMKIWAGPSLGSRSRQFLKLLAASSNRQAR